MIKKAALILFTFSALVGAHLVYSAAFAAITAHLTAQGTGDDPFPESELESSRISQQLALENFGPDHFTARPLKLSYYDKSRGSYMYAQNHEFSDKGKLMTVAPFAMISQSRDGKAIKTVTSDKAIIRFNVPFGFLSKNAEPQRVIHAELVGNVKIRDDKGTKANQADDLLIGPMTHVEYDEKTLQVTTDSDVVIQDQDMIITGTEMMLQLRRKAPAGAAASGAAPAAKGGTGSFDAETAFLYKNIRIVIKNVTSGGILPGKSKPDPQGQTPLDLQCKGQMRIDMPRAASAPPPTFVGPPNIHREADPTYCRFEKDVRVMRGVTNPDQLNCDMLYLTLRPDPPLDESAPTSDPAAPAEPALVDAAAPAPAAAEASGGPMTKLKLRSALAQGHAVWLQSESQGLTAKCVELKYDKKHDPSQADTTYLNGGTNKTITVEKVEYVTEGDKAGTMKSYMKLISADMSILDHGNGENQITARGPGRSEDRPNRSASITRIAWFEDQMMLQTSRDKVLTPPATTATADSPPALAPLRRLVTLFGQSKLKDFQSSTTLDAKDRIVAEFESGPKDPNAPTAGDGPSKIKWLKAYNNVNLTTPGRTLTAWKNLQAVFVDPDPVPVAVASAGPAAAPGPVVAQVDPEATLPEAKPDAPPPPTEGAVDARADRVFAWINQGQGNKPGDLREAKLRGGVMVHQEPSPGQRFPSNATGEALDLFSQGKGLMKFAVSAADPEAANPDAKTRLVSRSGSTVPITLARVEFDNRIIESENLISLDQQANRASARGKGKMTQMADAGLLDDKGLASDKPKGKTAPNPGARDKLTIDWTDQMQFIGHSRDRQGREAAKIEFRGTTVPIRTPDGHETVLHGVQAIKADAAIYCDYMDVYLDKVVDLSKSSKATGAKPANDKLAEPNADIAMIECHGFDVTDNNGNDHAGVDVTSQNYFEGTKILKDKYRIQHNHLIYDKRTGDFEGAGPGTAFLYKGKLPDAKLAAAKPTKPGQPEVHTMQLTKIQFTELMKGRFGVSKSGNDVAERTSEFTGNVQTANAVVQDSRYGIDFDTLDKLPDHLFLTSDALRVRSEPQLVNNKRVDHQLLYAQGNVAARTINRLIQGDRMTYDSATELIYVYGDQGKKVSMVEQTALGQMPNRTFGSALRYNKATGQADVTDPQNIQLFDQRTGIRPRAGFPDLGGSGPKPDLKQQKRQKLQRQGRTSTERRGFAGGQ